MLLYLYSYCIKWWANVNKQSETLDENETKTYDIQLENVKTARAFADMHPKMYRFWMHISNLTLLLSYAAWHIAFARI